MRQPETFTNFAKWRIKLIIHVKVKRAHATAAPLVSASKIVGYKNEISTQRCYYPIAFGRGPCITTICPYCTSCAEAGQYKMALLISRFDDGVRFRRRDFAPR